MISTLIDEHPLSDRVQDWPPLPEREHRPLHRAMLAALGELGGLRMLDVGCGVGLLLRAAELRGALVAGTDTAVERLEIARWALPDADLRVGQLDALPFDDGTFDVVTAGTAVHQDARGGSVLAELVRVARPGGRLAVGGWVRLTGCWSETFAGHLRGFGALAPASGDDAWVDGVLRSADLAVLTGGDVRFHAEYPSRTLAWRAMLGSEAVMYAIRAAGEDLVRSAFHDAVGPAVVADGSVRLPRTFRYAVAAVPS